MEAPACDATRTGRTARRVNSATRTTGQRSLISSPLPVRPAPEQFAVGGTADALAPGPVLAVLADRIQRDGLEQLNDDQLTGVLQAADRLASWAVSQKLAATSRLAARREAGGQQSGDWRAFDHVDDEVAAALTLTRRSAGRLLELALGLDRLPRPPPPR